MIKKQGGKYVVTTKSGRVLGTHDSKADAVKQLGAVEASKHRRAQGKPAKPRKPSKGY